MAFVDPDVRIERLEHFIDYTVRGWVAAWDEHAGCDVMRCSHAKDRGAMFDALDAILTP